MKILLVEDDCLTLTLLSHWLSEAGFTFDCARDGLEAVTLAYQSNHYQLGIIDIEMPELNGIAAADLIRSHQPHIVFIFTSSGVTHRNYCLHRPQDTFIEKPCTQSKLMELITAATSKMSGGPLGR
ncbi:MAG: response regulator [Gammaproteobacteria bacterium]|nr:response regulator [Gammaproteobacteria bacterium]MCF6230337.1 response regulator [Gammaproteobacteria bacterium]